jgi:hypothetical protein
MFISSRRHSVARRGAAKRRANRGTHSLELAERWQRGRLEMLEDRRLLAIT